MTGKPVQDAIESSAELLRVLGHETRLRILMLLAQGEHAVGSIDIVSGIGQPGLSQQLAILRKAHLVTTRRVAKQVYYCVDPAGLKRAAALLSQLAKPQAPAAPEQLPPAAERPANAGRSAAGFARML